VDDALTAAAAVRRNRVIALENAVVSGAKRGLFCSSSRFQMMPEIMCCCRQRRMTALDPIVAIRRPACERPLQRMSVVAINALELNSGFDASGERGTV
jgi:hypothetical protein